MDAWISDPRRLLPSYVRLLLGIEISVFVGFFEVLERLWVCVVAWREFFGHLFVLRRLSVVRRLWVVYLLTLAPCLVVLRNLDLIEVDMVLCPSPMLRARLFFQNRVNIFS